MICFGQECGWGSTQETGHYGGVGSSLGASALAVRKSLCLSTDGLASAALTFYEKQ